MMSVHQNGDVVYVTMKPLILACRVLGLQTIQINNFSTKPSYCGVIYTILVASIYVTLAYFTICYDINDYTSIFKTLGNMQEIFKLGTELVSLAYGIININRISTVLSRVAWLDCQMWKHNSAIQIPKDNTIRIHITLAMCLLVGRGILSIFMFPNRGCIFQITFFIADVLKLFVVLLFYNLVRLVSQRLEKINDLLKTILKKRKNLKISKNDTDAVVLVKQLNEFSCYYDHLCDTVTFINDSYMFLLLLLVIDTFIKSVITTSEITDYLLGQDYPISQVISKTLWFCIILGEFFVTVNICENVLKDTDETSRLLHQLAVIIDDSYIDNALNAFLMQLIHTKPVFEICGMFAMDNTLLHEYNGLLTTFIIIMVQFQDAKH